MHDARARPFGQVRAEKLGAGKAVPIKDKYSDVADTLQYLCLFLGEGRRVIGLMPVLELHRTQPLRWNSALTACS